MVCPMCITAAVVSNAPLIGAAMSGVVAAKVKHNVDRKTLKPPVSKEQVFDMPNKLEKPEKPLKPPST